MFRKIESHHRIYRIQYSSNIISGVYIGKYFFAAATENKFFKNTTILFKIVLENIFPCRHIAVLCKRSLKSFV